MREIHVNCLTSAIKELLIRAAYHVNPDMRKAYEKAAAEETSAVGKEMLTQILENAEIADKGLFPMCQDTGMAVVFLKVGQEVHFHGGLVEEAIHEGVRQAYCDGFLRKSVLTPLIRENTGDNTPAIIHYQIVAGEEVFIDVMPKGFGGENMSRIYMLPAAEGIEGVKRVVLETVKAAGGCPCPPVILGIGIGGDFEKAALIAKEALLRPVGQASDNPIIAGLEKELRQKINELGIGPHGLGGKMTALAVHINTFPTHISVIPVAVNVSCHSTRRANCRI